jgi:glycosyltransferase involved in cell wall biosynthesis
VFLEALERAVEERRIPREELDVVFVGHTAWAEGLEAAPRGLLRAVGHRPFFEALELLRDAAVLLLVIPPEGGAGNHTGKLFQYLASGRPILALAREPNVAADLVRRSRSGVVVPPDDAAAVAAALERLYGDWKRGRSLLADQDRALIARYEADAQAALYARLLNEVARTNRRA